MTVDIDESDICHLQYTLRCHPFAGRRRDHPPRLLHESGADDPLHRPAQPNTHGVSWLPLYHDMGLSMIGFPPRTAGTPPRCRPPHSFGGRSVIQALSAGSAVGQVVTAAPNFAYEWTAQRGLPEPSQHIDLSNVVMIIGSEPVSASATRISAKPLNRMDFHLPRSPSYGIAEATLMVATTAPGSARRSRTSIGHGCGRPGCSGWPRCP